MRFEQYFNANKIDLFPDPKNYRAPGSDHGTHVAGILAANWIEGSAIKMQGICPDLDLWDIRVLDDHGQGDEFGVVAGLRLVETINREAGYLRIHGVNLSLSITHNVANFACGWTPVCNACNDLVDLGVVVVASAGNTGFSDPDIARRSDGTSYKTVSITDPGNADKVITVGSTHGSLPHRYGTSYFSARGPTADGRRKPDLLAPGEAITAPIPLIGDERPDYKSYDGTSQAAPHVSGAAALLLARYPELRGQPLDVKRILCESATDLGREPYFQGYGLVDVLRALQSR
jgi:subtilisin family serine protease